MAQHTRDEVASRAGVEPSYVDQLVQLGLLTTDDGGGFAAGDLLRARWIKSLEEAGLPLEGMAAAVRASDLSFRFLDVKAFDRFAGVTEKTFEQVSRETGVPFDLLAVVRESFGLPEPIPADRVRDDEMAVIALIEFQFSQGFHTEVIERVLRVYADSFRRIADTETDAYRTEVIMPLLETGMSEGEMLDSQAALGSEMGALIEPALLAIYHGHQEHAWTKGHVETVETALERAGIHSRLRRPPAVSFLDLTGYTSLTEEEGDEAAAELAERLRELVRQSSRAHGGQSVKFLGDGVMFYFPEAPQSVHAALDMVEQAESQSFPPVRVGIHAGPVVFQEGDYFGRTVNVAARIADYARPGEAER